MIQNIPFELQRLDQWVCAGENKLPIHPRTGKAADVTDPTTWGTFAEACACNMKHVGFVLHKDDPYTIIDLDDPRKSASNVLETDPELVQARTERHCKILEAFESYAEYSQSGNGIHIIVKGKIPKGCRRDRVEVYSDGRYMICTGNPFNTLPITNQQPLLDRLFEEMSREQREEVDLIQVDSVIEDDDVCRMAYNAVNGDKFFALWEGKWKGNPIYPSQSEADYGLLSMLCFYSKDNEQVRRIFRRSALGQREKAVRNDKYLNLALRKIRANELPAIDFTALLAKANSIKNENRKQDSSAGPGNRYCSVEPSQQIGPGTDRTITASDKAPEPTDRGDAKANEFSFPPGFVGELASYFYASAIRPVPQIALTGAIALTAGIVARSYNISNTGLNQYLILIANTGTGKEGIGTCIEGIVAAARSQVPATNEFVGPSIFASGQALIRVLDKQPCFVSVLGEFGLTLQTICDPKSNTATQMLKRVLLDLYTKSGFHNVLRPSVYSDTEKNTQMVQAPCVTIIGESTPSTFYDKIDLTHIAEGLIPRFSVIEYDGQRPPSNENVGMPPPKELLNKFSELAAIALQTAQNRTFCAIQIEPAAKKILKEFDIFCDEKINSATQEVDRHLWNRGHLKALKLAGLVAVGCNPHTPIVTEEVARWALAFVYAEVSNMARRFGSGQVGNGSGRQDSDIRRCIADYLKMDLGRRLSYVKNVQLAESNVIPFGFIRNRALKLSSFTEDRRGVDGALKPLLEAMCNADILLQVPANEAYSLYKLRTPAYIISDGWRSDNTK